MKIRACKVHIRFSFPRLFAKSCVGTAYIRTSLSHRYFLLTTLYQGCSGSTVCGFAPCMEGPLSGKSGCPTTAGRLSGSSSLSGVLTTALCAPPLCGHFYAAAYDLDLEGFRSSCNGACIGL